MSGANILLNLTNNTDSTQTASLFNPNDVATNTNSQKYSWGITSFTFTTEQTVRVQRKSNIQTSFTDYTASITNNSFQGVVDALNSLQIGYFSLQTSGSNTYVVVYGLDYAYGNLRLFDINTLNIDFDIDAVSLTGGTLNFLTTAPTASFSMPIQTNGSYLNNGSVFSFSNGTGILGGVLNWQIDAYYNDYDLTPYITYTGSFNSTPSTENLTFVGGSFLAMGFRD